MHSHHHIKFNNGIGFILILTQNTVDKTNSSV
jgi:hypothetical protein